LPEAGLFSLNGAGPRDCAILKEDSMMGGRLYSGCLVVVFLSLAASVFSPPAFGQCTTANTTTASVVALDQAFFLNRLGAVEPQGMIFALRRDVVPINASLGLVAGNVQLRADKRPRPIVLRVNAGGCLKINFQNLLNPTKVDAEQPSTRTASIHVVGMQVVSSMISDGSNVGAIRSPGGLVSPNGTATYTVYAEHEGTFLLYSTAATTGGEGDGGSLAAGLFGAVNVEPSGAEYYRSQVTANDLQLATTSKTADGHPVLDFQAVYPPGNPRAGQPILRMTQGGELIYSDLNAIITGPNAGRFPSTTYASTPVNPDRNQPFREFTVVFHDEIGAVQAFPQFRDPVLSYTLHSVKDGFAINYGTGGIGAEILANRLGVGPVFNCTECKYEEFFLTSWALGDPAMIVDFPANATDANGNLIVGPKATKAFYPDDPSNVHHSYIGDHVKFRNLHAGPKEHHIFHLHAHQWVHSPDSDNSAYLDSQAIGPATGFTYEAVYNGGGNRNKTPGDAIFHCHFYPHFAQGMWELWRVHDVFESGTVLDANGRPAAGSRALPDAEILAGTPIPALVPIPTIPMAPLPEAQATIVNGQVQITGTGNPGFPFFVAAVAGHRPSHPPISTVDDGGLPRHLITGGTFDEAHTRLDFHKTLLTAVAQQVPENGTPAEIAAMNYHAKRLHPTFLPDGTGGVNFVTNGLPPVPGAPFADPCVDDQGNAVGNPRTYKSADIQLDVKLNKVGWHQPQQRLSALWGDVSALQSGTKAPEPLFVRANTNDCINFYLSNLVPNEYKQDDFQVRTPTDVLGQHIHLVKFDVLASDGAGNGWNYESGSFSPDEVIERIKAINAAGGLSTPGGQVILAAKPHPFFGVLGAQTNVERWYADQTLNNAGQDRTLRTVFTHDHYGPSTHQQAGLYAGLVVEPQGSQWRNSETGEIFGGRFDGGPTSFRADILTANSANSYREFLLEFADFQMAQRADGTPVNPPARDEAKTAADLQAMPWIQQPAANCPINVEIFPPTTTVTPPPRPCPEAIAADDVGTMVVNYRNEPVALRVHDPVTNGQAAGDAGDLSKVYLSNITRAEAALNSQPGFYPPLTADVQPGDPFTPLLRAYANDNVQIRVLVGAHEEGHNFTIQGLRWKFEPSFSNSGWRNGQMMGISEHFEMTTPLPIQNPNVPFVDYLYQPGAASDDQWNGLWGLLRVYNDVRPDLLALPNNPQGGRDALNAMSTTLAAQPQPLAPAATSAADSTTGGTLDATATTSLASFGGYAMINCPVTLVDVTATTAQQALPGGALVYNARTNQGGALIDPTAVLYVRTGDLDTTGKLKAGVPIEPLIVRAHAGDCIKLVLRNRLTTALPDLLGFNTMPMIVEKFNANQVKPSSLVGLRPQLVETDVSRSGGLNVGFNALQTVAPGVSRSYVFYAGSLKVNPDGSIAATPIEFGGVNLISSDPIKHSNKGAIAGMIIEPLGSTWTEDTTSRASATVTLANGSKFRDFTVLFQNDINMRFGNDNSPVPNLAGEEDPEDSGQKAVNYRTEPFWKRMGYAPDTPLTTTRTFDFTNVLNNAQVGGDPVTPIFTATRNTPIRFHVLMPGGHARNHAFNLHGHIWLEEPYVSDSASFGFNSQSEWKGSQYGHGPANHVTLIPVHGAGGLNGVLGDYLYRTQQSFQFDGGIWGILRVTR
jgi:hypothetical protein